MSMILSKRPCKKTDCSYGVPHASIRDSIYQGLKAGKYTRLQLSPDVLHHGEKKPHTVELAILPTEDENPTEFYLMSLIAAS